MLQPRLDWFSRSQCHYHTGYFFCFIGAIFWNIFTWYYGLPSSSSHALIGGLLGASIAHAGTQPLKWVGITKVLVCYCYLTLARHDHGYDINGDHRATLFLFYTHKV